MNRKIRENHMFDQYQNIWTTDKNKYILLDFIGSGIQIFNIETKKEIIIEDSYLDKQVKQQMVSSGNRIIRGELLKYVLADRPIPVMIGTKSGQLVFRCPDTGELIYLVPNKRCEPEPDYRLVIIWSSSIPLKNQVLLLRQLWRGLSLSTPELLKISRETKEFEFATDCWFGEARSVCDNAKELGLNVIMLSNE